MNNRAIYYSVHFKDESSLDYYGMLYYSLETLMKHYDGTVDIVVIWSAYEGFNIDDYAYLDSFNAVKDFPAVKFIKSDYSDVDVYMHRWYNFKKVFELGYDKVFYLDTDVIFFDNPAPIIDSYGDGFNLLFEGHDDTVYKVLGRNGAASGQIIVDSQVFSTVKDVLYSGIVEKKKYLVERARKLLSNSGNYDWFCGLSEQYAALMYILDNNIKYGYLNTVDVSFGKECYSFKVVGNNIEFIDVSPKILHYFGRCAYFILPERLRTVKMKDMFEENRHNLS